MDAFLVYTYLYQTLSYKLRLGEVGANRLSTVTSMRAMVKGLPGDLYLQMYLGIPLGN